MSHPSKKKGYTFEKELVDFFTAKGVESVRAWGSNGAALGLPPDVDLTAAACRIQAKRRRALPSYLQIPEGADVVAFRQDRGPTLILMRLEDFADDLKEHGW